MEEEGRKKSKMIVFIELLAVSTIIAMLMMVVFPQVLKIIENAKKDVYINTVQGFVKSARNLWATDNIICKVVEDGEEVQYVSSALPEGEYAIIIDTSGKVNNLSAQLVESGGKSPWDSRNIIGAIKVVISYGEKGKKVDYIPYVSDGVHGINLEGKKPNFVKKPVKSENLKRNSIVMSGVGYPVIEETKFNSKKINMCSDN